MFEKAAVTTAFALFLGAASTASAGYQSTIGWGCHTCGFKNGTELTGVATGYATEQSSSAVILPSGEAIQLDWSENEAGGDDQCSG